MPPSQPEEPRQEKPLQHDMVSAADSRVLKFLAMARRSF
jgi:hypothetical protein